MPLTALLAREELGLRLLAGGSGALVHSVHTSEMADPFPYLLGGELLLTAGVTLAGQSDLDRYVRRIAEAGGAALGFGLAPVHDAVPPALVAACGRYGLPLLEVPPPVPFTAVARAIGQLLEGLRHAELSRVTRAQQGLAAAAARPDPVPAVLARLASALRGWVVLMSGREDGRERREAGQAPPPEVRGALDALARVVTEGHSATATDTAGGHRLTAYALGAEEDGAVLGLASADPAGPGGGDRTIAGVAVVLLGLLTARRPGPAPADRTGALVRLLTGAAPQDVTPLLGGGPWTAVRGARGGGAGRPVLAGDAVALSGALGSALAAVVPDATGGHRALVLLPAGRSPLPQPGWVLGASAPGTDLPLADTQADRALDRALATGSALVTHRPGFGALLPRHAARAHAARVLAPLAGQPGLPATLRAWLGVHGSWEATAGALGVHRNTVRQRIARCAALLDADLDDADVRAELWLALREEGTGGG